MGETGSQENLVVLLLDQASARASFGKQACDKLASHNVEVYDIQGQVYSDVVSSHFADRASASENRNSIPGSVVQARNVFVPMHDRCEPSSADKLQERRGILQFVGRLKQPPEDSLVKWL